MAGRSEIPGSTPVRPASEPRTALPSGQVITVTVILQRDSQQDVTAVESFAREFCLQICEASAAKRTVKVSGSAREIGQAFGVEVTGHGRFIGYEGPITVPENLSSIVMAVLGLDTRPIAHGQ